jgi:arginyl-tRNA synthetase
MSGRKGIGVKADDLMDQLEEKSRLEISQRNRDLSAAELDRLAVEIATGALRFFMVRSGTSRVIAFDFDEVLSFEGDTGPYLQYALVRVKNICRRLQEEGLASRVDAEELARIPEERWSDDLWDLVLSVAQLEDTAERAARSLELSLLARHAHDLAQRFNAVYHRHPILHEKDPDLRTVRLAAALVFFQGLSRLADLLGIPIPDRM